jgi:hypothetical protein
MSAINMVAATAPPHPYKGHRMPTLASDEGLTGKLEVPVAQEFAAQRECEQNRTGKNEEK